MIRLIHKLTISLSAIVAIVALSANFFWNPVRGVAQPDSAESAAFCPISFKSEGSTTVYPITRDSEAPFEQAWPNVDVQVASIGSTAGKLNLTAGTTETAPSSNPFSSSEAAGKYVYKIARDAFVWVVNDSGNMSFLSDGLPGGGGDGLTKAQLRRIYTEPGLLWSDIDDPPNTAVWPSQPITPRARITASGTQPDLISAANLNIAAATEDAVILSTGLPRLVESSDMRASVVGNDYHIAYTSLANLPTYLGGDFTGFRVVTVGDPTPKLLPSVATVTDGTYVMPRALYIGSRDKAQNPRINPDNSNQVLADDWINHVRAAQALIAAEGFVTIPAGARPPYPNYDIDLNGATNILDLAAISQKWGASSNCKGWIRADANNNGSVSLTDIGVVTGKWAATGFGCAVVTNPCAE